MLQALVDAIAPPILKAQPTRTAFFRALASFPHDGRPRPYLPFGLVDALERRAAAHLGVYSGPRRSRHHRSGQLFRCHPLESASQPDCGSGALLGRRPGHAFLPHRIPGWSPEYLPRSGAGLPQIQFDAPRLLAHAYLYEADRYLRRACRGDVVRWMDDITFGVPNVATAKRMLRDLDELLASLGVRLNTGETKILTADEGVRHFRMHENRYLTVVQNTLKLRPLSAPTTVKDDGLLEGFVEAILGRRSGRLLGGGERFSAGDRVGYWEKVAKRFFTLFGIWAILTCRRRSRSFSAPALACVIRSSGTTADSDTLELALSRSPTSCLVCTLSMTPAFSERLNWWRTGNFPRRGKSSREAVAIATSLPSRDTNSGSKLWQPHDCPQVRLACRRRQTLCSEISATGERRTGRPGPGCRRNRQNGRE